MSKHAKNGRVEFLRFIFALGILFYHIHKRFAVNGNISIGIKDVYFFHQGYIGVEFFFLVSGYLLAASAYAKRSVSTEFIGTETAQMMWKKIKNVFPYHLYAILLTLIVNTIFLEKTAEARIEYVTESWASLFFLQVFGFDTSWVNKLTWYLDVWLMVTFMFWYFLRKHYDTFVKIVCPLMAMFVLGYMAHEYHSLGGVETWTGHFYKCFLRGFGEMALGCSTYSITRQLNKINFTVAGKRILAAVELLCYLWVLRYAVKEIEPKYAFMVLFAMSIGLILTFSNVNPCHKIFDKPIFSWFGKMSLLIYLNQFYSIRLIQSLLPKLSFPAKAICCIVVTFAGSILCDIVVGFFNKTKPFTRLMIKGEGE